MKLRCALLTFMLTLAITKHCVLCKLDATSYQKKFKTTESDSSSVCDIDYHHQYRYIIYVDPTIATKDVDCDLRTAQARLNATCSDINMALALHFHRDSTAFVLASGPHITHILKQDAGNTITFFKELTDVGIFGESNAEVANVECKGDAGLAFWNVDRIRLQNVELSFCGALRNSTSKIITEDTKYLMPIMVGVFFYNGSDVTMCRVLVQHGANAVGVLMYDTDGTVNIHNSRFVNNTVSGNITEVRAGGGGFNVEFSYCIPGDQACNASRLQATHNTNSSYEFYKCNFTDNSALALGGVRLIPHNEIHQGFGRGGGLAVFFKNNATNNKFRIILCAFERNEALWGGGMYIVFGETSIGNKITVEMSIFIENHSSGVGGGAIRILSALNFHNGVEIDRSLAGNSVTVSGYFLGNQALQGGAISFSPSYETRLRWEQTTYLSVVDSIFYDNSARSGAAIYADLNPLFVYGNINNITIKACIFEGNSIMYDNGTSNYDMGIGIIYSHQVSLSFQSLVSFSYNFGSALALINTHATFYNSKVRFVSNRADTGGAVAFLGSSHALVNENTSMYFRENFARKGGAIYNSITGQGNLEYNTACFIRYSEPFKDKQDWKASFTFINNTSTDHTSNSIFSTSVFPCALDNIDENTELSKALLFCHNPNWKFEGSNCTNEIKTEGDSYKFQNNSVISAFPGQGFNLPILVYDDLGHNITNSVGYTSTVSNDSTVAQVDPKFVRTSDNFLSIEGQENTSVTLELQSSGSRPHYLQMVVKLQQCPPGLHFKIPTGTPNNTDSLGKCICKSMYTFGKKLNCSVQNFEASIPWNYWIGIDPTGQRSGQLVMGELPNLYSEQDLDNVLYPVLPTSYDELDEHVCGIRNRTGTICGKCKTNYSTSVNSYNYVCTPCDDDTNFVRNIFIFMLLAYLPYIILLGAIAYFNLKFTSSATNGFILYAQMVSLDIFDINNSSQLTFETVPMHKAYLFVYGLFNFNSFANVMKPFCIRKNLTALDVLCFEYTLAGLPIVLIILMYLLLRLKSINFLCFRKQKLSIRASAVLSSLNLHRHYRKKVKRRGKESSLIHTLVAFILLSYTKLTLVSMKILSTQKLFDEDSNYLSDRRVYLAGHLSYTDKAYLLPYGLIAIVMMLFFAFIPPLFLLGFPQLIDRLLDRERFSCFKKIWPTVTVHIFLDAFQGFYKPNRRIFAGLYFVFRLIILILYVTTSNYLNMYILQQFFIAVMIVLLAIFKPYKREIFNIIDTLIFLNLALINLISTYVYASSLTVAGLGENLAKSIYIIQYCLLWVPLIYMLTYLAFKLLVKLGVYQCISERLHRESPTFFNPNSDGTHSAVQSDSEDEDRLSGIDSLSDTALFSRAEDTNRFRPAPQKRHVYSKTLIDVLTDDSEKKSDSDTTENGTNSG